MKKIIYATSLTLLFVPLAAFGAYNDVALSTSVIIRVGGNDFSVSGTTALLQSIVVDTGSFNITVAAGSQLSVTSSNQSAFTVTSDPAISSSVSCPSANSTLSITASGAATITVTPSGTCEIPVGGSSGGGGGGGGPAPAPEPTPTATTTATTTVIIIHGPLLTKMLQLGSTDPEVITLQQFFIDRRILVIPSTIPLGYFGFLTVDAVMKFQGMAGLDKIGTVGQKTRDAIYATTTTVTRSSSIPAGFLFTRVLKIGSSGADVAALQQILIAKGFLVFNVKSTPGYFGGLSKAAVVLFQKSLGLEPVGVVGPMTRKALNKITGAL